MLYHIGVGSALLVLLLVAMRRPRCAGQANDQFPRFFYAVTCSFVLFILSGNAEYMKNIKPISPNGIFMEYHSVLVQ